MPKGCRTLDGYAFLILRAQNIGLAAGLVTLAYFTFNTSYALLSYPLRALSDRIGRKPVMVGGLIWDRVSPAAPFWLGAGTALLSAVLLTF